MSAIYHINSIIEAKYCNKDKLQQGFKICMSFGEHPLPPFSHEYCWAKSLILNPTTSEKYDDDLLKFKP
jgi:hypothetical protein